MSKTTSVLKWGPKKGRPEGGRTWLHSPEALTNGSVVYSVKFLGVTDVQQSKGTEVVKEAIKKLKFANHIKRSEAGVKGSKLRKVEIVISIDFLKVQDVKTKELLYTYPLHRISYCADDKSDKKLFAFIAKDKTNPSNACFVFESEKLAEELTLTVGQAFELAYNRFLQSQSSQTLKQQSDTNQQLSTMQKQIQEAEAEKEALKQKIAQLETQAFSQQPPQQNFQAQPAVAQPAAPKPTVLQSNGNVQESENLLGFGFSSFETDQWSSKSVEDIFDPFTGVSQVPSTQPTHNQNVQFGQVASSQSVQNQAGLGSQAQPGFQPQSGFGNAPFNPFSNIDSSPAPPPQNQNQQPVTSNPFAMDIFSTPAATQQPTQTFTPVQPQSTAIARPAGAPVNTGGLSALPPPPGRQRPARTAQPFTAPAVSQAPAPTPFEDSFVQMPSQQSYLANDLADLQISNTALH